MALQEKINRAAVGSLVSLVCLGAALPGLPLRLSWDNFGGDGGDFLAAILTGGVPHPSGYPTYLLLGDLFVRLPWFTPVWRAALLSALCAAFAAGGLCVWIARQVQNSTSNRDVLMAAGLAGLAWGISPLLYSQAVIVEVYALQALIFVLSLTWCSDLLDNTPGKLGGSTLAVIYGVGLGNHLTGFLLFPAILALWIRRFIQGKPGSVLAQVFACLLGLTVYLVLPFRAAAWPPVNWGNAQTWEGFWWLVSGQPYRGLVFHTGMLKMLERISALAGLLVQQYGIVGVVLGVTGAASGAMKPGYRAVLYWTALAYALFAIGYATDDSSAYLIPFFGTWAVWIALGLIGLTDWRWRGFPLGWVVRVIFAISIFWQAVGTFATTNPRKDPLAEDSARMALAAIPVDALVLTHSDADSFPLWYLHFGLKERTDLRVVVVSLTQFSWYRDTLRATYPDLNFPKSEFQGSKWGEELPGINPERIVCHTRVDDDTGRGVTFTCSP